MGNRKGKATVSYLCYELCRQHIKKRKFPAVDSNHKGALKQPKHRTRKNDARGPAVLSEIPPTQVSSRSMQQDEGGSPTSTSLDRLALQSSDQIQAEGDAFMGGVGLLSSAHNTRSSRSSRSSIDADRNSDRNSNGRRSSRGSNADPQDFGLGPRESNPSRPSSRGSSRAGSFTRKPGRDSGGAADMGATGSPSQGDRTPPLSPPLQHNYPEAANEQSSLPSPAGGNDPWASPGPCEMPRAHLNKDLRFQDHKWAEPDPLSFAVRSKTYLQNKKKLYPDCAVSELLATEFFSTDSPCCDAAGRPEAPSEETLRARASKPVDLIVVCNLQVPAGHQGTINCVFYYGMYHRSQCSKSSQAFWEVLDNLMADPDTQQGRLKFIPRINEGPWLVKKAVGARPVLLGGILKTRFYRGSYYFEIDFDVDSNPTPGTGQIVNMVKGAAAKLIVDIAFVIQANDTVELPEMVLGTASFVHCKLGSCPHYTTDFFTPHHFPPRLSNG